MSKNSSRLSKINHSEVENFRSLIYRNDFSSFLQKCFHTVSPGVKYLHNYHIDLIAEHLSACETGEIKRLIINIPPRYMKSLMVNVAWPCWLLGKNTSSRIISTSYSQSLSTKHSLDSRLIVNSPWYHKIFPETLLVKDQNEKDKFVTSKRGFRLATSVGGTVTGEGGNFLILDDPQNPAHIMSLSQREAVISWYEQVFASRLDDKNKGVIVLIMQRLHRDDLSGHLLKKGGWEHLSIPAINQHKSKEQALHSERESLHQLKMLKEEIGSFAFSAQYQQNPIPQQGGMIKPEWLRRYKKAPEQEIEIKIQSWDTAIKSKDHNDYSACVTLSKSNGNFYIDDVSRYKLEYPELKRQILANAEKYKPDSILIEDKASGQSLIQELKFETQLPVIAINPKQDKITRAAKTLCLFEAGKIFIPEIASWLADFEAEILSFPSSPNDDQLDALTQALNWLQNKKESYNIRGL